VALVSFHLTRLCFRHVVITDCSKLEYEFLVASNDTTFITNFIKICLVILELKYVSRRTRSAYVLSFVHIMQRTETNVIIKIDTMILPLVSNGCETWSLILREERD
jgi:hypothetical protein